MSDIGGDEVSCLGATLDEINPDIGITEVDDRWRPTLRHLPVLFMCVDSIDVRRAIWENAPKDVQLFIDGRMLGETIRVLAATQGCSYYPKTLFDSSEANRGSCTSQSTIYAASIAAGLMVHQYTRWLRDIPLDRDMLFSLLAGSLSPVEEE